MYGLLCILNIFAYNLSVGVISVGITLVIGCVYSVWHFCCRKWVINCRRADLDKKTPDALNKSFYLCAEHFEVSQFTNSLHNRLKWNALPTLFTVRLVIYCLPIAFIRYCNFQFFHAVIMCTVESLSTFVCPKVANVNGYIY